MQDNDININMDQSKKNRRSSKKKKKDEKMENLNIPDHEKESTEAPALSSEDKEALSALIKELELTENSATLKRTRQRNFEVLNNMLSEYLDSYFIIGYTAENDELVAQKINNSKDSRALYSLLDDIATNGFPHHGPPPSAQSVDEDDD